jgi:hypothetical protein
MLRLILIASAIGLATTATVIAQSAPYQGWYPYGNPDDIPGSDCVGHCGAGCSNTFGYCDMYPYLSSEHQTYDAPDGYWSGPTQLTSAVMVGDWYEYHCTETPGVALMWHMGLYNATFRYTFHGYYNYGCYIHDMECEEWYDISGCWWMPPCIFGNAQDWDYDVVLDGAFFLDNTPYEDPSCPGICPAWGCS